MSSEFQSHQEPRDTRGRMLESAGNLSCASEEFLEGLINSLPIGIAITDAGRRLILYNHCLSAFCDPKIDLSKGERLCNFVHGSNVVFEDCRFEHVLKTGQKSVSSFSSTDMGKVFSIMISPVRRMEGMAYVHVFADTTEEMKLQHSRFQNDKLNSLGLLAAGIAHEINNPVGFVSANLQLSVKHVERLVAAYNMLKRAAGQNGEEICMAQKVEETLRELGQIVSECIEGINMISMISRSMNFFSRISNDNVCMTNVNDVLDSALILVRNELKYRATVEKQYSLLPLIPANSGKLCQVFLNILINAAHAMDDENPQKNFVRIATSSERGGIAVAIENSGRPIPDEIKEKIFDPFFTTKPAGKGTGLGLTIAKEIAAEHGGGISVESGAGRNTKFTVRLALDTGMKARAPEPDDGERPTSTARYRILIVDDDGNFLNAIFRSFTEHEVLTARSGYAALREIQKDARFDAILCDLMMKGMSGWQLYEEISKRRPGLEKKMIFVTGGPFTPKASDFVGKVKNVILEKPVDMSKVRKAIATAAAGKTGRG